MILHEDGSGPVTGESGDAIHGACRVCEYRDPATGALMYRIEKEAAAPEGGAEMICMHVSAAFGRRVLAQMQKSLGGDLGANGCLLLIRPAEAAQASGGDHKGAPEPSNQGQPDLF